MLRPLSRRAVSALALAGISTPFIARLASGQTVKKITFLLDVPAYSKHALFYPAIENGYFAKRGLDVTFSAAKGSADAAQRVASKTADFGFIDAGSAILARSKGLPLKLTSMVHYKNMMAMLALGDPPITKPKDLEGRKIAASAGDAVKTGFMAVAKLNGVDMDKIQFVTTEPANKRTLLFAGQVGALCDYAVNYPVYEAAAERMGKKVSQVLFSDFGLDIYSNGMVTRDDLIKNDPAMVKKFNDAMVESMVFAVEKPDEAVKIFLKFNAQADPALTRAGLDVAIAHLMVPEVAQHGIGPMDPAKIVQTIASMKAYFDLTTDVAPADLYSNDFVTAGNKPAKA